ncbi:dTDP-glucose 4,6-dehydratase [Halorubrum sp. DM2]|uniref:UDP-glucuronic acid decarboxylase family protein n=1 Tax=unclassified Halorubrum TaxID=2642239 RepID=UPI0003DD395F|nr:MULTISPECIES: UDP-glucuronic acid decarboxylase family protein [unclassified Halorubrum]CDK39313.1 dTDP-glucose 4-6-dehydratase [Halorubrum sp. AJ67]VTT87329.1 dTDP-glucose 4,6-dehydratase [Halorubrum sp. DM2]
MSRILVTGAAGFLGSFLCDRLLADGHEVIGMDNQVSGRTENLDDAFYHDDFSYYEHDVTEFIHVSGELDAVLHLASLASPVFYRDHPIKTLKVGALGTHKTLGLAKEKDATYLFTSTSEVYGDPEVNPQPESYRGNVDSYGPRSCYDESKRYGESLVRAYRDQHDLDVRVARIFNTYGPRMRLDDGRVIPNFMKQALTGEDLTVYGDGEQTRSFCYVSDMIDGLVALLESDVQEPVNIGNPDERTINELAEVVREVTESESGITHKELPPQDPQVRRPDITKAREELEWEPTVDLRDGLRRSVPYFTE